MWWMNGRSGVVGPLCSRNPHDEKNGKGIHVGPVLPERAPLIEASFDGRT